MTTNQRIEARYFQQHNATLDTAICERCASHIYYEVDEWDFGSWHNFNGWGCDDGRGHKVMAGTEKKI